MDAPSPPTQTAVSVSPDVAANYTKGTVAMYSCDFDTDVMAITSCGADGTWPAPPALDCPASK